MQLLRPDRAEDIRESEIAAGVCVGKTPRERGTMTGVAGPCESRRKSLDHLEGRLGHGPLRAHHAHFRVVEMRDEANLRSGNLSEPEGLVKAAVRGSAGQNAMIDAEEEKEDRGGCLSHKPSNRWRSCGHIDQETARLGEGFATGEEVLIEGQ